MTHLSLVKLQYRMLCYLQKTKHIHAQTYSFPPCTQVQRCTDTHIVKPERNRHRCTPWCTNNKVLHFQITYCVYTKIIFCMQLIRQALPLAHVEMTAFYLHTAVLILFTPSERLGYSRNQVLRRGV